MDDVVRRSEEEERIYQVRLQANTACYKAIQRVRFIDPELPSPGFMVEGVCFARVNFFTLSDMVYEDWW